MTESELKLLFNFAKFLNKNYTLTDKEIYRNKVTNKHLNQRQIFEEFKQLKK